MAEQSVDSSLLASIIQVSEKAGKIARICRQDAHLLSLLIQEKKETEKNPRYVHDFKTLADVLVQEVVKYELSSKFPALLGHIYGEESNEFDLQYETVTIEVKPKLEETVQLLAKVLPDAQAANTLAEVVHSADEEVASSRELHLPLLSKSLAIWIDPIDSTAEYISGKDGEQDGKTRSGLQCVTVLIGVFDRDSGLPIIGVINQPFYVNEQGTWRGRYVYGVCVDDFKISPPVSLNADDKVIAVSSSESEVIKTKLSTNGFRIMEIAGAGFKLLNIIVGAVDGYVLSKATTFMWDICAAHAILRSMGGDIVDFSSLDPIRYRGGVGVIDSCNKGGIVAFRDPTILKSIVHILDLKRE